MGLAEHIASLEEILAAMTRDGIFADETLRAVGADLDGIIERMRKRQREMQVEKENEGVAI